MLGFTHLQFEALLTAARQSPNLCDFALVAMLGRLGLRIFEAGADIADLGEEHGRRVLRVCGKGTKVVLVPLPPAVGRAIDRAIGDRTRGPVLLNTRGGRMDRHAATRRLHQLAEAAGIQVTRAHPHMLRHTFVTTSFDPAVDLRDVQIAARHADPRTTVRYDRARQNLDRHLPGRRRGPHAEPLLGAVSFEPLHLGEPQLRREAHRADVGGLGKEHQRLAGKRAGEPAECRCARLGGVPESPRLWQEQVAELGLPGSSRRTVPRCSVERDRADHRSVEIDYEMAGAPLRRLRHRALELVTRSRATEVDAHLWRGEQLDERRTVPGLGLAEHEPLGPDRGRRPSDGSQVCHERTLTDGRTTESGRSLLPAGPIWASVPSSPS